MNRIAKEADKLIYGNYITIGDLIVDSPTKTFVDGSKEVVYYFMVKEWPLLQEDATIWIDGDKLGYTKKIHFRNTSVSTTPWLIKSVTIRNIPDTKVVSGGISCHGLLHLHITGFSEKYQGLLKWSPSRRFATGHFGLHIKNSNMFAGHGIEASIINGGSIKLDGFEVQFGFAGVRLYSLETDFIVENTEISNFYIHDTCGGEGFYIGTTQAGGKAKLKNLTIKNGFLARTAAESVQVQHLIGGADVSDLVIYAADTDWLNAFQGSQDTTIQWVNSSGINKLSNILVDGFAGQGFMPHGSDGDIINAPKGKSIVDNIFFNDGRNIGTYLHKSASYGINWSYNNLYYRGFNETYTERTGEKKLPYIISKKWGTDPMQVIKLTHDGSKANVFENTTGINVGEVILDTTMPAPKYVNTGFPNELASKIKQWHQFFGAYFDGPNNTPTHWKIGDIAIDSREDGSYVFCKCVQDHITATGTTVVRPKESSMFTLLTWDENGIRNDQVGYIANSIQSLFPPDDLRLKNDCYWKAKGFGVKGIVEKEEVLDKYIYDGELFVITDQKCYKTKIDRVPPLL